MCVVGISLVATVALAGCALFGERVPGVVARAPVKAEVMTWPIKQDSSNCFPGGYEKVRVMAGRVMVEDVGLYENRRPLLSEGLVAFCVKEKCGYVDASGRVVIEPQFDEARLFRDGAAVVRVRDRYGYIRKNGTWLRELIFDFASDFEGGYAAASENGKYGILDVNGRWWVKPQFVSLSPLEGGLHAVRENGEEGFFDPNTRRFILTGELGNCYKKPRTERGGGAER